MCKSNLPPTCASFEILTGELSTWRKPEKLLIVAGKSDEAPLTSSAFSRLSPVYSRPVIPTFVRLVQRTERASEVLQKEEGNAYHNNRLLVAIDR